MLTIWNTYTKNLALIVEDMDEARDYCARQAQTLNHGVYRYWEQDNATYFDCGPITYKVKKGVTCDD